MAQALDDLLDALEDVDDATREEASKALAELADPTTLDALGRCLWGRILDCHGPMRAGAWPGSAGQKRWKRSSSCLTIPSWMCGTMPWRLWPRWEPQSSTV